MAKEEIKELTIRNEGDLVVLHNDLIANGILSLTLIQYKILMLTLGKVNRFDETKKDDPIILNIQETLEIIGMGGKNHAYLRKNIDKLLDIKLIIPYKNGEIFKSRWISSSFYKPKQGIIEIRLDTQLQKYLFVESQFTQFNPLMMMRFSSQSSVFFYMYLKMKVEINKKYKVNRPIIIEMDKIYQILQLSERYQNDFSSFKSRILEPALKDLELTDIKVKEWTPIKTAHKTTAIEFIARTNNKLTYELKQAKQEKELKKEKTNKYKNKTRKQNEIKQIKEPKVIPIQTEPEEKFDMNEIAEYLQNLEPIQKKKIEKETTSEEKFDMNEISELLKNL